MKAGAHTPAPCPPLQLANKRLEQQLGEARQQVGVTPERSRAVLREVQDKAER